MGGGSVVSFRIGINADLTPQVGRVAMRGRMRGQTIRTASPARIVPKAGGYELLPTAISIGSGTAKVAGTYGSGMKIQSRLENIDMALVNAFMPGYGIGGTASGSFDFEQASATAFPRDWKSTPLHSRH